jgi:WhiB family transcriptional regulator, redox-sensing transcriptional regulator
VLSAWDRWAQVDWSQAECEGAGLDRFFSDDREHKREAKALCKQCPIQRDCLRYATVAGEVGVWGGMTDGERKAMVKRLRARRR